MMPLLPLYCAVWDSLMTTFHYYQFLFEAICLKRSYSQIKRYNHDLYAKVFLYSYSLIFKLFSIKHYRSPSYRQDMMDNLKNVAVPGTGIPLSIFCYNQLTVLFFLFVINPLICLFSSIYTVLKSKKQQRSSCCSCELIRSVFVQYNDHLLHPSDWFSFWRLNCSLVSYHATVSQSEDYAMEDKWTFLQEGNKLNVPITPYLTMPSIVCKNKNIEGGMGIYFYKNACHGGDWIIQKALTNDEWLKQLLPTNSPLSTMRIITASTYAMSSNPAYFAKENSCESSSRDSNEAKKHVKGLSCVLRLGREGAMTDHSSIMFNVDLQSGIITSGTTNAHWYQLGLKGLFTPWHGSNIEYVNHPDAPYPVVAGQVVPDMKKALDIVINAHYTMMKDVPLVGWDVSFTPEGIYLLEVNLSCNFFKGKFNVSEYIQFVHNFLIDLEKLEKI